MFKKGFLSALILSLVLMTGAFTNLQPVSAATDQGDSNLFKDTKSGFSIQLESPTSTNITSNVIDELSLSIVDEPSDSSGDYTVSIVGSNGEMEMDDSAGYYSISNFDTGLTKTTKNYNITVNIYDSSKNKLSTIKIPFNYYNMVTTGASQKVDYVDGAKITAFSGAVSLQFPKNSFLTNVTGTIAPDQTILFSANSKPADTNYVFLGPSISVTNSVYNDVYNSVEPVVPGTITLSYNGDGIYSEVAKYNLSIVKQNGAEWIPIGGTIDSKKQLITAPFSEFATYAVVLNTKTYGMDGGEWSKPFVLALTYKGIVSPANHFNYTADELSGPISRKDFTVMMAKAMGWNPVTYDDRFYDLNASAATPLEKDYIQAAVNNGFVQGTGVTAQGESFSPDSDLTREQAAVFVTRALKLKVDSYTNLDKVKVQVAKAVGGSSSDISDWAIPSVSSVVKAKVMQGTGSSFDAQTSLTLEQACTLVYNVMEKLNKFGK